MESNDIGIGIDIGIDIGIGIGIDIGRGRRHARADSCFFRALGLHFKVPLGDF